MRDSPLIVTTDASLEESVLTQEIVATVLAKSKGMLTGIGMLYINCKTIVSLLSDAICDNAHLGDRFALPQVNWSAD